MAMPSIKTRQNSKFPIYRNGPTAGKYKVCTSNNPLKAFPVPRKRIKEVWWTKPTEKSHPEHLFSSLHAHNPSSFTQLRITDGSPSTDLYARDTAEIAEVVAQYRKLHIPEHFTTLYSISSNNNNNHYRDEEYCLVPTRRLEKLDRIEKYLVAERERLTAESVFAFQDTAVSARLPFKFVVDAIQSLCEADIQTEQRALFKIKRPSVTSLNKTRVARDTKNSTVLRADQALALSFSNNADAKRINEIKSERNNLALMEFEEKYQRQMTRLINAVSRKVDYDIYVSLTIRFGPLCLNEFNASATPGKTFTKKIVRNLLVITKWWKIYGPPVLNLKSKSATLVQKHFRGFSIRCSSGVVVKRFVSRRREFKQKVFTEYAELVARNIKTKRFLRNCMDANRISTFGAWVKFTKNVQEERANSLKQFWKRMTLHVSLTALRSWRAYTERMHRVRHLLSASTSYRKAEVFKTWVCYKKQIKEEKRIFKSASCIQSVARGVATRRFYEEYKSRAIPAIIVIQRNMKRAIVSHNVKMKLYPSQLQEAINEAGCIEFFSTLQESLEIRYEELRFRQEQAHAAKAELLIDEKAFRKKFGKRIKKEATNLLQENHVVKRAAHFWNKSTYDISVEDARERVFVKLFEAAKYDGRVSAITQYRVRYPPKFICHNPDHNINTCVFATRRHFIAHENCHDVLEIYEFLSDNYHLFLAFLEKRKQAQSVAYLKAWKALTKAWIEGDTALIIEEQQTHVSTFQQILSNSQQLPLDKVWPELQQLLYNILPLLKEPMEAYVSSKSGVRQLEKAIEKRKKKEEKRKAYHHSHRKAAIKEGQLYGARVLTKSLHPYRLRDAKEFLTTVVVPRARLRVVTLKQTSHECIQLGTRAKLRLDALYKHSTRLSVRKAAQNYLKLRAAQAIETKLRQAETSVWLKNIQHARFPRMLAQVELQVRSSMAHIIHVVATESDLKSSRAQALAWLYECADSAREKVFGEDWYSI